MAQIHTDGRSKDKDYAVSWPYGQSTRTAHTLDNHALAMCTLKQLPGRTLLNVEEDLFTTLPMKRVKKESGGIIESLSAGASH